MAKRKNIINVALIAGISGAIFVLYLFDIISKAITDGFTILSDFFNMPLLNNFYVQGLIVLGIISIFFVFVVKRKITKYLNG